MRIRVSIAYRIFFCCRQAADELGGKLLGGAGEEGLGEGWEVLEGRGGYGSRVVS